MAKIIETVLEGLLAGLIAGLTIYLVCLNLLPITVGVITFWIYLLATVMFSKVER